MKKSRKRNRPKKFGKSFKKKIDIPNVAKTEDDENSVKNSREKANASFLAKNNYKKIISKLRKWNSIFCKGMLCKANIKRDAVIIGFAVFLAGIFLAGEYYKENLSLQSQHKKEEVGVSEMKEENFDLNVAEIKSTQEQVSLENWKEYQSSWYGFKIKYPQNWKAPAVKPPVKTSKSIYRVSFLSDKSEGNFRGFEVAIYDINIVRELSATDEFPKIKEASMLKLEACQDMHAHVIETGNYSAEEIYISSDNDCHESALFFSVTDGRYIYNIAPIVSEAVESGVDLAVELGDKLPEFFAAVSSFENIDIVRPKLVSKPIQKPKVKAPMPASYKVEGGRLVCEKKNDKPAKSNTNKKKHLDMECCLDPDEYPNPHCYYDPEKYGKYLK